MKIAVLGAGVAGVTTAYVLASRGHDVDVIEQASEAATECSYANGGQLSYTHAEPWANPGVFPKLFKWMFQDDAPLVFRLLPDPHQIKWSLQFLLNCSAKNAHRNCETMLRLGMYSREKMHTIDETTKLDFDYRKEGILHIFTDQKALDAAIAHNRFQMSLGLGGEEVELSREECIAKEPALASSTKPFIGGMYSAVDESGDVRMFTAGLAKYCAEKLGVTFHYNTRIAWLREKKSKIKHIETSKGKMTADAYIVCLGAYSPKYVRGLGIPIPVYPMKGYSITVPAWESAPTLSITDDEKKIVFSRLGDRIRAAGTAEFAGYNQRIREKRIRPLLTCMKEIFPEAQTKKAEKWACLRPQTPDGPPLVGPTKYNNLYLHTGHGTLGWTQSAGTAHILADIIEDREPEISIDGLTFPRRT